MRVNLHVLACAIVSVALLNTSCVTVRTSRIVTLEDVLKMAPFDATVEDIEVSHPFMLYTVIDIFLRKVDGGYRLDLEFYSPNKNVVGLIHNFNKGQRYLFPQVFIDYMDNHQTNTTMR